MRDLTMPKLIPKPPRAEEVLTAVAAARYPAGSTVTLAMIAGVSGVNELTAGQIRRWARSVGRWAYVDGKRGAPPNESWTIGPTGLSGRIGRRFRAGVVVVEPISSLWFPARRGILGSSLD